MVHKAETRASQTISHPVSSVIQIVQSGFVIWILHLFKYIKICNVTKLLAYEKQTPFKWTKHGSLHFLWLVRLTHTSLFYLLTIASISPSPADTIHRLLTMRVPNTNEVRKWFDFYRSCRTCLKATKKSLSWGKIKKLYIRVCITKEREKKELHSFASLVTK